LKGIAEAMDCDQRRTVSLLHIHTQGVEYCLASNFRDEVRVSRQSLIRNGQRALDHGLLHGYQVYFDLRGPEPDRQASDRSKLGTEVYDLPAVVGNRLPVAAKINRYIGHNLFPLLLFPLEQDVMNH
jgi:hypothetical protein